MQDINLLRVGKLFCKNRNYRKQQGKRKSNNHKSKSVCLASIFPIYLWIFERKFWLFLVLLLWLFLFLI